MPTGTAYLWSKIARRMQVLAFLAPLFVLALFLAWLLSSETVFSFFQSPTSPLPPTEEAPLPTETSMPTEARPTLTSPPLEAPSTLTPAMPPTEGVVKPTLPPTEAAFLPAVQMAAHPTVSSTAEPPTRHSSPLWPWVLLGLFSLGAMGAGIFLLRREAPAEDKEGSAL